MSYCMFNDILIVAKGCTLYIRASAVPYSGIEAWIIYLQYNLFGPLSQLDIFCGGRLLKMFSGLLPQSDEISYNYSK